MTGCDCKLRDRFTATQRSRDMRIQAIPPIHIIVDNGHVTLEGVVNNKMEKTIAGIRASQVGLSFGQVVNNLRVENPAKKTLVRNCRIWAGDPPRDLRLSFLKSIY